jgi:tripartite-type tricarboxylate transporter receptor subunit TctC
VTLVRDCEGRGDGAFVQGAPRLLHGFARVFAAIALTCICGFVHAQQDYPTKPVTLLIPFPPGTGNDVVGRTLGTKLSEYLSQRFVPDNRSGASGMIAIDAVRRAPPDGYTLVVASTSFTSSLHTTKVNFGIGDFTPVALIGKLPYTLMVAKSLPGKNMKELVELLKQKPGQLNAGSGGATGTSFFLTEQLKKAAHVEVQLVPYKGTVDGVADLLAERTQLMFAPMVTSLPQYRAGKIQLAGVTGSKRSALMPEVATFTEQGYPMLDIPTWFGLLGPAGLPRNVVKVVSDAVAKALASKDVIDALGNQGVEPGYGSPAEFEAFLKADNAMWARLVKESGIKPQ